MTADSSLATMTRARLAFRDYQGARARAERVASPTLRAALLAEVGTAEHGSAIAYAVHALTERFRNLQPWQASASEKQAAANSRARVIPTPRKET